MVMVISKMYGVPGILEGFRSRQNMEWVLICRWGRGPEQICHSGVFTEWVHLCGIEMFQLLLLSNDTLQNWVMKNKHFTYSWILGSGIWTGQSDLFLLGPHLGKPGAWGWLGGGELGSSWGSFSYAYILGPWLGCQLEPCMWPPV